MRLLVTGGLGFIGSNFIRYLIEDNENEVDILNIDKLSYASNPHTLENLVDNKNYEFLQLDIANKKEIDNIFSEFSPNTVINFAAESHVDRSIDSPSIFIDTNINGTFNLLNASLKIFNEKKDFYKFIHISTDEVFGDLEASDDPFTEASNYVPSSPYSASKASSDHLVRAWNRTFKLPTVITNCSNNYGPFQHPEKLIPKSIINAISGKKIPIYGNGSQIRDWLHVNDHIEAILKVHSVGEIGESYNIGANNEMQNITIIKKICGILDDLVLKKPKGVNKFSDLIEFIKDRPGHDQRYAIDNKKICEELNWSPRIDFSDGLKKTIKWYLDNKNWWEFFKS